jgi:hypothetical protein
MYTFSLNCVAHVTNFVLRKNNIDHPCGLVVRVPGYRSRGHGFQFLTLSDILRSSGSGTGSTQPREDN